MRAAQRLGLALSGQSLSMYRVLLFHTVGAFVPTLSLARDPRPPGLRRNIDPLQTLVPPQVMTAFYEACFFPIGMKPCQPEAVFVSHRLAPWADEIARELEGCGITDFDVETVAEVGPGAGAGAVRGAVSWCGGWTVIQMWRRRHVV
jgi:hypothetical protein